MKTQLNWMIIGMLLLAGGPKASAHCEVPCGIYDDELRIALLYEHFITIEKAMNRIMELSAQDTLNHNQIVRWINTKEAHANDVQHIVDQYFMTQRIQPADPADQEKYEKYIREITLLHRMLILAMKTKQTTDPAYIVQLRETLKAFEDSYFEGQHRHNPDGSHK